MTTTLKASCMRSRVIVSAISVTDDIWESYRKSVQS